MVPLFLILSGSMWMVQAATPPSLPDTPQGRRVEAYIKAFNSGEEKTFLQWFEKAVAPEVLKRRTAEERSKLYARMREDFGRLVVRRVAKATAEQIQVVIPTADGQGEGTFTFDFEAAPPHRITGLAIEVQAGNPAAAITQTAVGAPDVLYQSTVVLSPSSKPMVGA